MLYMKTNSHIHLSISESPTTPAGADVAAQDFGEYLESRFTDRLVEHAHRAKRNALRAAEGEQERRGSS